MTKEHEKQTENQVILVPSASAMCSMKWNCKTL
jgi:hypothetical protein